MNAMNFTETGRPRLELVDVGMTSRDVAVVKVSNGSMFRVKADHVANMLKG